MQDLKIELLPIADLLPYEQNAHVHDERQLSKLASSIKTFGFNNPVLIDPQRCIIAGHGRVEAARLLGLREIPCITIAHLSPIEQRAYILADNRLAQLATWDEAILADELFELSELDLDFDITVTGFELAEIDLLVQQDEEKLPSEADLAVPGAPSQPVSRPGDLWRLGKHRLLCGDATNKSAYAALLADTRVDVVFTDPPYNVPIQGHVTSQPQHGDFAMASGEMSAEAFVGFLADVLGHVARVSRDGALHYVCMDWRHLGELLSAAGSIYTEQINLCVWNKNNGGMGSMYRSKHELVGVFKVGNGPHINNVQLGRFGRYRTNVWDYPGMSSLQGDRDDLIAIHPTVKPVMLIADALADASHRGNVVLDPFAGSGSTLLAAERTGRIARLIEIDPKYADVCIARYEAETGQAAVHVETGQTFEQLQQTRLFVSGNAQENNR